MFSICDKFVRENLLIFSLKTQIHKGVLSEIKIKLHIYAYMAG